MIDQPVTRRRFLALVAGACALAGGGALGGMLAACGKDQVATNTTATIAPGQTTTTTTAPRPTTTTVSTMPEMGRPLRIGVLTAKTGRLALFGKADHWWMEYAAKAMPDGIICGDRKLRKIRFLTEDHGSAGSVSAQAAGELISEARVDLLMCSGAANVVNAAAAEAESRGCPFICDFVPWQSFLLDRGGSPARPFKWTYAHAYGPEDVSDVFVRVWQQLLTNKKVGLLFADDEHGRLLSEGSAGLPALAAEAGYEAVMPGPYAVPGGDFTLIIDEFMKQGCEVCAGDLTTADLATFWHQARQRGFKPTIVSVSGAMQFPQAVDVIGSSAGGMTAECLWQPTWPYTDSITGKTAAELARDYEARTGEQWTIGVAQYAKFEWAVDVFKRVVDIIDKEDTLARVRTTRLETCLGLIDFTAPVTSYHDPLKSRRPAENVYKAPVGACQWEPGKTYPFEPTLVATGGSLEIPLEGSLTPMAYEVAI
jgi:branched-chain amino acid transport system substrate-binding protein